ncbi:MAG: SDR family NAD(P)-dependent oxidoreductase, partial [Thermodesulfobacteriota bacterium]
MSCTLEGRVALVTGANQGLGLEIARAYIQAGASLVICARNEALLKKAEEELNGLKSAEQKIIAITADVS